MIDKFKPYLETIGIYTPRLLALIDSIYRILSEMCPEEIQDIFVSEFIKDDQTREYQNLWFFSPSYVMEAKQFINTHDLDIAHILKGITYYRIRAKDYDFKVATEKSRLNLEFLTVNNITCDFKAGKENCDSLRQIILKYVKPNLVS